MDERPSDDSCSDDSGSDERPSDDTDSDNTDSDDDAGTAVGDDAGTDGDDHTATDARDGSEAETPPPSASEMVGRRVTVRYDGENRPATVVDSSYARNTGDLLIAVKFDAPGGVESGSDAPCTGGSGDDERSVPAGERIVVGEARVSFD